MPVYNTVYSTVYTTMCIVFVWGYLLEHVIVVFVWLSTRIYGCVCIAGGVRGLGIFALCMIRCDCVCVTV